ncbi:endospore germination permease [Virgibacillus byunsanensis]|uniref:Endospore germination permease n=1 Tax=Virgibacillus byunsanensis TaxID=570945 RepID=A0ABW3LKJ2_9BACI
MKNFEYADEKITDKEIMIAVPSMVVAVGILSLPRELAKATTSSDGWIPLTIMGILFIFLAWVVAKLAASFPNQSFLTYATSLVTKPVAIAITFLFVINGVIVSAYEVRVIAGISSEYLFDNTPMEVIGLCFLLVVVYAVSGSRVGLLRLNTMFFPIIMFIALVVVIFSLGWVDYTNLLPMFESSFSQHLQGLKVNSTSFIGFGAILLFYIPLVREPEKAPKMAAVGMTLVVGLSLTLFITCIGVFGGQTTADLVYPTIELAKEIKIPGGFFERFESVFFVIWIMAIFNTTAMALDIAVLAFTSIFKNTKKIKVLLILSPIVYFIGMFMQDHNEVSTFGTFIGYYLLGLTLTVTILFILISKIKGAK